MAAALLRETGARDDGGDARGLGLACRTLLDLPEQGSGRDEEREAQIGLRAVPGVCWAESLGFRAELKSGHHGFVWAGRDLEDHPVPPLPWQGHLPLSSPNVQPGLGHCQGSRGSHSCSGHPCQGLIPLGGRTSS
ncbi:hypothetical protein TURU_048166 [Turdus rufiventris]|nr:hypothetical protein TURU_048166 [Turdus rufiventris]